MKLVERPPDGVTHGQSAARRRAAVLLAVVMIVPMSGGDRVEAVVRSNVVRTVGTTTVRWGAVATERGTPAIAQPLSLTWRVNKGTAHQYVDIVNVGGVSLTGQSFQVTNTSDKDNRTQPSTVTFEACLGGSWSTTTHVCSGRPILIGNSDSGSFTTANTPLGPGDRLELKASTSPNAASSYVTTVNVIVTRSQTAAAGVAGK